MALTQATKPLRLKDFPSIMDYDADSKNDDSGRILRAVADGVDTLFIPSAAEVGVFRIGDLEIQKNIRLIGDSLAGYRKVGAVMQVHDDASFGIFFKGTGTSDSSGEHGGGVRVIGGGISNVYFSGETTNCGADFIKVQHCSSFLFENIGMRNTKGCGYHMRDFMESKITNFYMNSIGGEDKHPFYIGDIIDSSPWNVNNLHIEKGTMGSCGGNWLHISDRANADLIWFEGNKLEWDSNSLVPNSSRKAVIYAGHTERFMVLNNGFTYMTDAHNKYDTILEISEKANYGNIFIGNSAYGCDGTTYWDVKGGTLLTDNNITNTNMKYKVTSKHNQAAMCPPEIRTTTGNKPLTYDPKRWDSDFLPAHKMGGASASNTFTPDDDAVMLTTLRSVVGQEIRRMYIPKDMIAAGRVLEVTMRVKNDSDQPATAQLQCGGTAVNYQNISTETSTTTPTIQPNSGWTTLTWYVPPSAFGNGQLLFKNNGGAAFLFDGASVKYADKLTVTLPWSSGNVAQGATVNTTATLSRLGKYVKGVSAPVANNSTGGAISSAYFNRSSNTLVLQLSKVTSGEATVTANSYTLTLFF